MALHGSFRHLARMLVPREDSNIWHCWIIEMLYTSADASDETMSLLISSTLLLSEQQKVST